MCSNDLVLGDVQKNVRVWHMLWLPMWEKESDKMARPGNDCSYIHSVAESLFILGSLKSLPDMDLLVSPGNQVAWPLGISGCRLQLDWLACLNMSQPGESPKPPKDVAQPNEDAWSGSTSLRPCIVCCESQIKYIHIKDFMGHSEPKTSAPNQAVLNPGPYTGHGARLHPAPHQGTKLGSYNFTFFLWFSELFLKLNSIYEFWDVTIILYTWLSMICLNTQSIPVY